jgi:hypothetical protein
LARATAVAAPMPALAPVTRATFPCHFSIDYVFTDVAYTRITGSQSKLFSAWLLEKEQRLSFMRMYIFSIPVIDYGSIKISECVLFFKLICTRSWLRQFFEGARTVSRHLLLTRLRKILFLYCISQQQHDRDI